MIPNERFTEVTINERKFRIGKFDARTGSFMLIKISGMVAPFVKNIDMDAVRKADRPDDVDVSKFNIAGILSEIGKLSEDDFAYVQDKCLRVCSEILPSGVVPVIADNGAFGVIGLDDDTMTVMALTAHALIHNIKGFFSGSPLGSLVGGLLNTSQHG